MISQEKLDTKLQTKAEAIAAGVENLQETINGYDFNADTKVVLADHAALDAVIALAVDLKILVNEFGTLRNVSKTPKAKAAEAAGRVRRNRGF